MIVILISHFKENLIFNVAYFDYPPLLKKYLLTLKILNDNIESLNIFQEKSYFFDLISEIIGDLSKLKEKILASNKDSVSISGAVGNPIKEIRKIDVLFSSISQTIYLED